MNELTFVAKLGAETTLRRERREAEGLPCVIASGDIEERETDPETGRVVRCDMRLNSRSGLKLASGEFKRPEHPEGKDPRNEGLRADARKKALARGLKYYFTCNMSRLVLFALPSRPGETDQEVGEFLLADIAKAEQAEAAWSVIRANWVQFLDFLEPRLDSLVRRRPAATRRVVVEMKAALDMIVEEVLPRARRLLEEDATLLDDTRKVAASSFGLPLVLKPGRSGEFNDELSQILRLTAFVTAQKLVLHRVLSEAGPKRKDRFTLDPIEIPRSSTDPNLIRSLLQSAVEQAIQRSRDYETAFLPTPKDELLFQRPTAEEVGDCRVGSVWANLCRVIQEASWEEISQNLVGFLYETIIDPKFRHELGQYYTQDDVVDLLTTFAITDLDSTVLDPAAGGGGFVRSAYQRKIALGELHEDALSSIWACEITAFAAQLTSITLATANTDQHAAYPRVLLRDFFTARPGMKTEIEIPGDADPLRFPRQFDAIIGNPPYISYRRQTNQPNVERALRDMKNAGWRLPQFSGKSDEYVWFLVHGTQFLAPGGRLAFVVSSALLFSDYGIPLIQLLGSNYRIVAVVDSLVEQWFESADTNTLLLLLQREPDATRREANMIRFVRLRQALAQLLPGIEDPARRQALEDLVDALESSPSSTKADDPRFQVNLVAQGSTGGLLFADGTEDEAFVGSEQDEE